MRVLLALIFVACASIGPPPPVEEPPEGTPVIAMLERGACFGACPVYTLIVYQGGSVLYDGVVNVKIKQKRSKKLKPEEVAKLEEAFARADFFAMADGYEKTDEEDPPTITVTYTRAGKTKKVTHVVGDPAVPATLLELEDSFDGILGAADWTGVQSKMEKKKEDDLRNRPGRFQKEKEKEKEKE